MTVSVAILFDIFSATLCMSYRGGGGSWVTFQPCSGTGLERILFACQSNATLAYNHSSVLNTSNSTLVLKTWKESKKSLFDEL